MSPLSDETVVYLWRVMRREIRNLSRDLELSTDAEFVRSQHNRLRKVQRARAELYDQYEDLGARRRAANEAARGEASA